MFVITNFFKTFINFFHVDISPAKITISVLTHLHHNVLEFHQENKVF